MGITQQTIIDQREIRADGTIQVRFALRVMNGESVVTSQWHRCSLVPGCDPAAVISAINDHIAQDSMGSWPPISDDDAAKIKATCEAEWTPDVISAYRANLQ